MPASDADPINEMVTELYDRGCADTMNHLVHARPTRFRSAVAAATRLHAAADCSPASSRRHRWSNNARDNDNAYGTSSSGGNSNTADVSVDALTLRNGTFFQGTVLLAAGGPRAGGDDDRDDTPVVTAGTSVLVGVLLENRTACRKTTEMKKMGTR
jgi:hypothetical protein